MRITTRWVLGIAMVATLIVAGMGFAAAQGGQTSPSPGGMMGSTVAPGGMMGSTVAPGGMMGSGTWGAGSAATMAGVDMEAMHEQMLAAMTGKIPADVLARCDALHDQMMAAAGGNGTTSAR